MGFFKNLFASHSDVLYSPVSGTSISVTKVPDATISEGLMGKGIAIVPTDGRIFAPCDATVDAMFKTGHAVSLSAANGAEILIHIGLETVRLQGRYFTVHCNSGDSVKKGDLLIEFDRVAIENEGFNTITTILVCNSNQYTVFKTKPGKRVTNHSVVIKLAR